MHICPQMLLISSCFRIGYKLISRLTRYIKVMIKLYTKKCKLKKNKYEPNFASAVSLRTFSYYTQHRYNSLVTDSQWKELLTLHARSMTSPCTNCLSIKMHQNVATAVKTLVSTTQETLTLQTYRVSEAEARQNIYYDKYVVAVRHANVPLPLFHTEQTS